MPARSASGKSLHRSSSGMGLVEILISLSILSIVMLGIATFQSNQMRAQRALAQKYESLDLKQALLSYFSSAPWINICSCQLNPNDPSNPNLPNVSGLKFDSTDPSGQQKFDMQSIFYGCGAGATGLASHAPLPASQTGLQVSSIKFSNLKPVGSPTSLTWTGTWEISLSGGVTNLAPVTITQFFSIDAIKPGAQVVLCTSSSLSNPATALGCNGDLCRAYDYGPCIGIACVTNGNSCTGDLCTACGATPSCTGTSCCAGPTCAKCSIYK